MAAEQLMNSYYNGNAFYCDDLNIFYMHSSNIFYDHHGIIYEVRDTDHRNWISQHSFRDHDGNERDIKEKLKKSEPDDLLIENFVDHDIRENITNLIKVDIMSLCSVTDTEGNRPTTSWEKQMPCSFAHISLVADRCMHWRAAYNGHCSCHDAYAHKTGAEFLLPREAEKSGDNAWFTEAEEVHIDEVQRWHMACDLPLYRTASNHQGEIYYYEKWDVFFDGYGHFQEKLTTFKRKGKFTAKEAIHESDRLHNKG